MTSKVVFANPTEARDMFPKYLKASSLSILLLPVALFFTGCAKSSDEAKNAELPPRAASTESMPSQTPQFPQATPTESRPAASAPPKPEELKEAVARVFDKSVSPDPMHNPNFLVGDFNGDGVEDLAVVTRPADGSLNAINNELANWTLEDPGTVPIPGTKAADRLIRPKPVKVQKGDMLLAIIHGVGAQGWRNPEARQTYLLKNGTGSNMIVQSATTLRSSRDKTKPPALRGDAISQTLGGKTGLLFWTGAKYAWYSPPE